MFCRQRNAKISFIKEKLFPLYFQQITAKINTLNTKPIPSELNLSGQEDLLKKKFNDFVVWYEQLTGMDEVRMMQKRVLDAQDRFVAAQEKRRNLSKELNTIQSKLKEVFSELDTTSRGEERYLQLITQEHAILKDERKLTSEFGLVEREERDSFTNLSSCVKESHERERAQAERTKYWSIIGSIVGTVIGIIGSSINNEFKMKELRKLVKDLTLRESMMSSDVTAASILSRHEGELSKIVREMKAATNGVRVTNLAHQPHNQLERKVDELKDIVSNARRYNGQLVAIPGDLEALFQKQTQETRLLLIGVSIIGIALPIFLSCLQR